MANTKTKQVGYLIKQVQASRTSLKRKVIKELKVLYVENPSMVTDIDSYNYGIHDCIKKIKSLK